MSILDGNEFEALKLRFENQTELLYRMTLIDLRIFSGLITLQLAFGAWLANKDGIALSMLSKLGLLAIDASLTCVAMAMLYNNSKRRVEVKSTVINCAKALGYKEPGKYLDNEALDVSFVFRPWAGWYFLGVVTSFCGVILVLFANS